MSNSISQTSSERRLAIAVRGVVQGVGFRPFIYNTALAKGLSGWVLNESDMVRLEVQGDDNALDDFVAALRHKHPPQARIDELVIREIPCEKDHTAKFQIQISVSTASPRPTIPADLATCAECVAEIREPAQRRHGYPFTNCTNCGPRWSIIEQLPYDRPRTSMAGFSMCSQCQAEYENPADRRFHAQPIACPQCGPKLELLDSKGNLLVRGGDALAHAASLVFQGRVLALKGLGGFQLVVDATSDDAVARLRERKQRPDRPFALMMSTLEEVRYYCNVSEEEARMLTSHQAPIVLLKKLENVKSPHPSPLPKGEGTNEKIPSIVEGVAPGNPYLGVMLPYTPLHYLLMAAIDRPIVCTSGNLSEDPMAISSEEAISRLGSIADVLLTHDRPIVRPVDDSIVRMGPSGFQVLRRARGFAPLPIQLNIPSPTILAVGGHLKNTVALCLGNSSVPRAACQPVPMQENRSKDALADKRPDFGELSRVVAPNLTNKTTPVVMSAHIGDLDNLLSVQVFQRAIDDLVNFFAVTPDVVACDLHPDYASTRQAESLAAKWDVLLVRVQHHHAHVAAAVAEHALEGPVLGLAWDGTGYGTDGTIWGGEALRCDGADFTRLAHLRTFALPGGDRAIREPRRSALAVLYEILGHQATEIVADWFSSAEISTLNHMLASGINSPRTSSLGRLFDAVAALCGLSLVISFEGQAAMALEFAAEENEASAYSLPLHHDENQILIADWEPMLREILSDRKSRVPVSIISAKFHNALAEMALGIARFAGLNNVVLTGGCFQNALLSKRVYHRLQREGFSVYLHKEVPPGDGGIALGQIYIAALRANHNFLV
ncbi:MAG TPA: carbamoyltransferase HypF [Thermoguttaceae bacterium]